MTRYTDINEGEGEQGGWIVPLVVQEYRGFIIELIISYRKMERNRAHYQKTH